jgi:hypothetical protein
MKFPQGSAVLAKKSYLLGSNDRFAGFLGLDPKR